MYIKMLTIVSETNISTLSKVLLFPIFTWYLKHFIIVFQFSDKFVYKPEGALLVKATKCDDKKYILD